MLRHAAAVVLAAAALAAPASAAVPPPFGHACTAQAGVRFCPTASNDQRVPAFDGAPLDADVTLPATGDGPFPTLVMIHGYTKDKTLFETTDPSGGPTHFSNVYFAKHGYAVVNFSVRGAGNSCGPAERSGDPKCDGVQFELGDQRYDARDVQDLLGILVDEGVADRDALAVSGVSLGSLETLELAFLKDRIRKLDGSYAPWLSPKGTPLHIAAAYPFWAIVDVLDLAAPNGRVLDFRAPPRLLDLMPIGVIKLSFPALAAASLPATVSVPAPFVGGGFDFAGGLILGETQDPHDPRFAALEQELVEHHQALGVSLPSAPAPILMEDGWNDDVVNGASQAWRMYRYVRGLFPKADVSLQLADYGHMRDLNRDADAARLTDQALVWLDAHLHRGAGGPAPGSVTAYTAPCPATAPAAGPFIASSGATLHPGAVRFTSPSSGTLTSTSGGDPQAAAGTDPIAAEQNHCATFTPDDDGVVVATRKVARTFTMLGAPTIRATIATTGEEGQLDSRLWDVDPSGKQTLVTRGAYALDNEQKGQITFQLFGDGYTFAAGHTVRLELLGQDTPFLRTSQKSFSVRVSDITVELPTHEAPDGGEIVAPLLGASASRTATCASRRVVVVHTRGLRHARVMVDGKAVRVRHGRAVVRLVGRARGAFVVRTTGRDARGRAVRRRQVLHTCRRRA